jgi:hypothetical protein
MRRRTPTSVRALVRALVLLLVGLPMLARPSTGRLFVECADGTPCDEFLRAKAAEANHSCCESAATEEQPPTPADKRCVLRGTPPTAYVVERTVTGAELTVLPPIALLRTPNLAPAANPVATVYVQDEIPPPRLDPKQGRAPRAPPLGHA